MPQSRRPAPTSRRSAFGDPSRGARRSTWCGRRSPTRAGSPSGSAARRLPRRRARGRDGTFGWSAHGDFPARIEAYEPPHRFAFRWGMPASRSGTTTARSRPSRSSAMAASRGSRWSRRASTRSPMPVPLGPPSRTTARDGRKSSTTSWCSSPDAWMPPSSTAPPARWRPSTSPRRPSSSGTTSPTRPPSRPGGGIRPTSPPACAPMPRRQFEHEGQRFPIALRVVEPPATFAFRWGSFGEAEPWPRGVRRALRPRADRDGHPRHRGRVGLDARARGRARRPHGAERRGLGARARRPACARARHPGARAA